MAQQNKKKTKKRRRRMTPFNTMLILLGVIAVLIVATLFMRSAYLAAREKPDTPTTQTTEEKPALFSVREVTVSGDTRYLPEAIVQQSGLYVGQSVWSVDKLEAAQRVLAAFPYIQDVQVTNTAYNKLNIAVTETKEIGVMYGFGQWLAVGSNGKVLETEAMESDRPMRTLYLKGATPVSDKVGEQAMDDRSFAIVTELLAAFAQYGLDGINEIDLTNKSDLRMNWNNRIEIKLGNDSNLTHEVGVVVSTLPGIQTQYGDNATGRLDVSAFSDDNPLARAVFTPQDLLTTTTTTTTTAAEGDGAVTTTAAG